MKFKLTTSAKSYYIYYKSDHDHLTKLKSVGFTFKETDDKLFFIENKPTIDINSMDELIQLIKKFEKIVIMKKTIEIYDSYRE